MVTPNKYEIFQLIPTYVQQTFCHITGCDKTFSVKIDKLDQISNDLHLPVRCQELTIYRKNEDE